MPARYGIEYATEKIARNTIRVTAGECTGRITAGMSDGHRVVSWQVSDGSGETFAKSIPGNEIHTTTKSALDAILYAIANRDA